MLTQSLPDITSPAVGLRPATDFEFSALLQAHHESKARERQLYTSEAELYLSFMATLPEVQAVSFDIFDTALVRYVDHPVDVFFHLEQHPAFDQFAFRQPVSGLRIAAESKAREMVFKIISSYEVNLLEIYQVFCDLNGISRDYAEAFVAAEEEIELELCVACAPLQRLYQEAVAAGKKALFVSDTYHGVEFLTRLLRHIGYEVAPESIIASSATRKAKQSGHLFPFVLSSLGIEPDQLLHLGDHPISDDERPRALGIRTILHSQKASSEQPELSMAGGGPRVPGDDPKLAQRSKVRGMVRSTGQAAAERGRTEDFWWKFGYSSAGPLTVGFCQWLEQSLRN